MAAILNFSLLIIVAPFVAKALSVSRFVWCFVTIFSGLAVAAFWWVVLVSDSTQKPYLGGWCLIIALFLNFTGLLLAGPRRSECMETSPVDGDWSKPQ